MSNSEKILKVLSNLIESGVLTSKDLKKEISNELKFKKDKIVNKLELVSRQEFEILKKIVQKQEVRHHWHLFLAKHFALLGNECIPEDDLNMHSKMKTAANLAIYGGQRVLP